MQFQKVTLLILLTAMSAYGLEVLESEKTLPTAKMEEVLKQQQVIGKKPEAVQMPFANPPSLSKEAKTDYERRMKQGTLPKTSAPAMAYEPLEAPTLTPLKSSIMAKPQQLYRDIKLKSSESQISEAIAQKDVISYKKNQLEQTVEQEQIQLEALQNQIQKNPSPALLKQAKDVEGSLKNHTLEYNQATENLKTLEAKQATLEKSLASSSQRYALEPTVKQLEQPIAQLKADVVKNAYLLEHYQSEFKKAESAFSADMQKSAQLDATLNGYNEKIGTLKSQLDAISDKNSEQAKAISQQISALNRQAWALMDQWRDLYEARSQYQAAVGNALSAQSNYDLARAKYIQLKGQLESLKTAQVSLSKMSESDKQKALKKLQDQAVSEMGNDMYQEMVTTKETLAKNQQDPLHSYKSNAATRQQFLDHPEQIPKILNMKGGRSAIFASLEDIFRLETTFEKLEKEGLISETQAAELVKLRAFSNAWDKAVKEYIGHWRNIGVPGFDD